jgi:hypothetical protein
MVSNGSGVASANVTNIQVTCGLQFTPRHPVPRGGHKERDRGVWRARAECEEYA